MSDDYFMCVECGHPHPAAELHHKAGHHNTKSVCNACNEKRRAMAAGEIKLRADRHKRSEKNYRAGKLPPWMFS